MSDYGFVNTCVICGRPNCTLNHRPKLKEAAIQNCDHAPHFQCGTYCTSYRKEEAAGEVSPLAILSRHALEELAQSALDLATQQKAELQRVREENASLQDQIAAATLCEAGNLMQIESLGAELRRREGESKEI